jgi:hypothetical protein
LESCGFPNKTPLVPPVLPLVELALLKEELSRDWM